MHKSTKLIHGSMPEKSLYGEISVPISQTSIFAFPSSEEGAARFAGQNAGYIYSRLGNPTVNALEKLVCALEHGYSGIATASGMAAITSVFLGLLGRDVHVVATDSLYGATRVVLESDMANFGVSSTFVNSSNPRDVHQALQPNTRMVFIETPTNPTMVLTDLRAVTDIAHTHGALLVVDNTFASPYLQRPLEHGADLVVHSLTKFINGHSDVIGGMIVTASSDLERTLRRTVSRFGGIMDPHQAWLILRGVQSLSLRMEKAQRTAMQLADYLSRHPKVLWVRYPGLADHPQHELAKVQMDGFGTMICFGVKQGLEGGKALLNSVRLIILAVSLGGMETLIEHPASMTHAAVPRHEREAAGIRDELIRLSVGCEDFEDLRQDLDQALQNIPA